MAEEFKNIVYLSYDGLTDPLGQSQIMPYITGLTRAGYGFTIISFEKSERFEKHSLEIRQWAAGYQVEWLPQMYHKNPPILSTLYDLWVLWREFKKAYRLRSFQIVHCRSYLTALVGLGAKNKYGIKFIFDMRGFWADERVEGGLWNVKNPVFRVIYQFFKRKEKQFLESADHIVSLTENAKQEILLWGLRSVPITVIPTCVDLDLFDPNKIKEMDKRELRERLGLGESDFVLLYLGSWGTWYMTDEILVFFARLKEQKPEAKFLIVSGDLIELNNYPYKADVIVTQVPRQLVPLHISLANASVCFIKPTFSKKASSATKMGEIMAMDVPLVSNKGWGDIEKYMKGEQGVLLDGFSERDYQLGIQTLLMLRQRTFQSRELAVNSFSLDMGIAQYKNIYQTLISDTRIVQT